MDAAQAIDAKKHTGTVGSAQSKGKVVQVDWSVNLGEHPQHIFNARLLRKNDIGSTGVDSDELLVVGERHIYYMNATTGELRTQKRIDSEIVCATTYPVF